MGLRPGDVKARQVTVLADSLEIIGNS